ncbi:membrane hypothetical protein [Candidatus Xenohaliotis californiensis]|uniref:Uncharacterized protein n=1 Tax=Candidatus Xenohaliotis californiensis TaxID=84677 RepID=A0ABM9N715_9RICK|nr:membrane hypothetical protein [Candidatus Xenohaliotis californiensis]
MNPGKKPILKKKIKIPAGNHKPINTAIQPLRTKAHKLQKPVNATYRRPTYIIPKSTTPIVQTVPVVTLPAASKHNEIILTKKRLYFSSKKLSIAMPFLLIVIISIALYIILNIFAQLLMFSLIIVGNIIALANIIMENDLKKNNINSKPACTSLILGASSIIVSTVCLILLAPTTTPVYMFSIFGSLILIGAINIYLAFDFKNSFNEKIENEQIQNQETKSEVREEERPKRKDDSEDKVVDSRPSNKIKDSSSQQHTDTKLIEQHTI